MAILILLGIFVLILYLFSTYVPFKRAPWTLKEVICCIMALLAIVLAVLIIFSIIPTPNWTR